MDTLGRLKEALEGRYRVERQLGAGGMALVFLAEDLKHHRRVAIKVLRPEVSAALGKERFLREIEIAAGLNHPNILALHDSGEADGLLFFVMPFVEGESLRVRLDREGELPVEEATRITREIGSALGYAHSLGLIHRDIKPENILFQAGHALVCDFGIAQVTSGAGQRLTLTGISVGTFTYMSPEQLTGDGPLDARTDVYALGCLLHEMLSGAPPFRADSPQASLAKKLTAPVEDLTQRRSDVPHTVQTVIETSLAIQTDARFPTAEALVDALGVATTTFAIEKDALRRRSRKNRRRAGGLVGVASLAAVTWWVSTITGGPIMDRIAVLPLVHQPPDTAQEYFVQGVHQDLVMEISRAGVRVINPSSVTRYVGTDRTVPEIARELNVDGVIQGEATVRADSIGIELRLVDAEDDVILWTASFAEPFRNVLTLYGRATQAIAQTIGYELGPEVLARLAEAPEVDPQVYELLLQARFQWQKLTEEGFNTAMGYYDLALERDSLSAEAWFGIAQVWFGRAQQGLVSSEEAGRHGDPAMARAAEIDPNLSAVKAQLAGHLVWSDWDWDAGEEAFLQALESDPTDSPTRAYYSQLLFYLGREEEALREVERAAELDPFNSLTQAIYAQDLNFLHRYSDAETVLLGILERDPESPYAFSTLRTTYHLMGRQADAMRMFRASYAAVGDTLAVAALDAGYEAGGYAAGLLAVAELFVERAETTFVTPWQIATLYTRAGVGELALDYLEEAFDARDQNMPSIAVDPIFDFIRDEPRFQALVDRLNLPR